MSAGLDAKASYAHSHLRLDKVRSSCLLASTCCTAKLTSRGQPPLQPGTVDFTLQVNSLGRSAELAKVGQCALLLDCRWRHSPDRGWAQLHDPLHAVNA